MTDFDRYAYQPGAEPQVDLFVDHALHQRMLTRTLRCTVIARPTIGVCMVSVPSKVWIASRLLPDSSWVER